MNSMIWNVRGIGGLDSQKQIWYLRNHLRLNIFAILEPMVQLDEVYFCNKFRMDKVVSNRVNKIWLFSDSSFEVEVLEDKVQYLHCKITSLQLPSPILITIVYAKCTRSERRVLWEDMRNLATNNLPWSIGGDFNVIMNVADRDGGARPNYNAINDFATCVIDCGLNDVGFEGETFTWKWQGLRQRLDRVLFNHLWLDSFTVNKVTHGVRRLSDHKPLLIEMNITDLKRKSSFRFQDMWLKHPDCIKSIEINWSLPTRNKGLHKLWEKLHRLKQFMQWWNKHVFGDLFDRLRTEELKVATAETQYNT